MNNFHPTLHNADVLIRDDVDVRCGLPNGRWVAARPLGAPTLVQRFKLAWGVFTGRYDALEWTGQE